MQIVRLLAIFAVLGWVLLMELGLHSEAIPLGSAAMLFVAWSRSS